MDNVNKDNTEEKILRSAHDIFEKKGYNGAKMQAIADNAGINKALLHYYFRSKDKLFEKIFTIAFNKLAKNLEFILDSKLSIIQKIELFVDKHIDFLGRNRYLPLFIVNEVNRRPDIIAKVFAQLYEKDDRLENVLAQIKNEQMEGILCDFDPRQILTNLISLNIFPFAAKPILKEIFKMDEKEFKDFIEQRKQVIKDLIINMVKKK